MSTQHTFTEENAFSTLVLLGGYIRPGQVFTPPAQTLTEFKRHADSHNGKVLYTTSARMSAWVLENSSYLIVRSKRSQLSLIGKIEEFGRDYAPGLWARTDEYQPIDSRRERMEDRWIKISDVRLADTNEEDFEVFRQDGTVRNLEDVFAAKRPGSVFLIRPRID